MFPKTSISTDVISVHQCRKLRYSHYPIAPNIIKNGKQLSHYWVKSSNVDDIQSFGQIHFFLKHRILGRETSVGIRVKII